MRKPLDDSQWVSDLPLHCIGVVASTGRLGAVAELIGIRVIAATRETGINAALSAALQRGRTK